jgi:hypothetical protein
MVFGMATRTGMAAVDDVGLAFAPHGHTLATGSTDR